MKVLHLSSSPPPPNTLYHEFPLLFFDKGVSVHQFDKIGMLKSCPPPPNTTNLSSQTLCIMSFPSCSLTKVSLSTNLIKLGCWSLVLHPPSLPTFPLQTLYIMSFPSCFLTRVYMSTSWWHWDSETLRYWSCSPPPPPPPPNTTKLSSSNILYHEHHQTFLFKTPLSRNKSENSWYEVFEEERLVVLGGRRGARPVSQCHQTGGQRHLCQGTRAKTHDTKSLKRKGWWCWEGDGGQDQYLSVIKLVDRDTFVKEQERKLMIRSVWRGKVGGVGRATGGKTSISVSSNWWAETPLSRNKSENSWYEVFEEERLVVLGGRRGARPVSQCHQTGGQRHLCQGTRAKTHDTKCLKRKGWWCWEGDGGQDQYLSVIKLVGRDTFVKEQERKLMIRSVWRGKVGGVGRATGGKTSISVSSNWWAETPLSRNKSENSWYEVFEEERLVVLGGRRGARPVSQCHQTGGQRHLCQGTRAKTHDTKCLKRKGWWCWEGDGGQDQYLSVIKLVGRDTFVKEQERKLMIRSVWRGKVGGVGRATGGKTSISVSSNWWAETPLSRNKSENSWYEVFEEERLVVLGGRRGARPVSQCHQTGGQRHLCQGTRAKTHDTKCLKRKGWWCWEGDGGQDQYLSVIKLVDRDTFVKEQERKLMIRSVWRGKVGGVGRATGGKTSISVSSNWWTETPLSRNKSENSWYEVFEEERLVVLGGRRGARPVSQCHQTGGQRHLCQGTRAKTHDTKCLKRKGWWCWEGDGGQDQYLSVIKLVDRDTFVKEQERKLMIRSVWRGKVGGVGRATGGKTSISVSSNWWTETPLSRNKSENSWYEVFEEERLVVLGGRRGARPVSQCHQTGGQRHLCQGTRAKTHDTKCLKRKGWWCWEGDGGQDQYLSVIKLVGRDTFVQEQERKLMIRSVWRGKVGGVGRATGGKTSISVSSNWWAETPLSRNKSENSWYEVFEEERLVVLGGRRGARPVSQCHQTGGQRHLCQGTRAKTHDTKCLKRKGWWCWEGDGGQDQYLSVIKLVGRDTFVKEQERKLMIRSVWRGKVGGVGRATGGKTSISVSSNWWAETPLSRNKSENSWYEVFEEERLVVLGGRRGARPVSQCHQTGGQRHLCQGTRAKTHDTKCLKRKGWWCWEGDGGQDQYLSVIKLVDRDTFVKEQERKLMIRSVWRGKVGGVGRATGGKTSISVSSNWWTETPLSRNKSENSWYEVFEEERLVVLGGRRGARPVSHCHQTGGQRHLCQGTRAKTHDTKCLKRKGWWCWEGDGGQDQYLTVIKLVDRDTFVKEQERKLMIRSVWRGKVGGVGRATGGKTSISVSSNWWTETPLSRNKSENSWYEVFEEERLVVLGGRRGARPVSQCHQTGGQRHLCQGTRAKTHDTKCLKRKGWWCWEGDGGQDQYLSVIKLVGRDTFVKEQERKLMIRSVWRGKVGGVGRATGGKTSISVSSNWWTETPLSRNKSENSWYEVFEEERLVVLGGRRGARPVSQCHQTGGQRHLCQGTRAKTHDTKCLKRKGFHQFDDSEILVLPPVALPTPPTFPLQTLYLELVLSFLQQGVPVHQFDDTGLSLQVLQPHPQVGQNVVTDVIAQLQDGQSCKQAHEQIQTLFSPWFKIENVRECCKAQWVCVHQRIALYKSYLLKG